MIALAILFLLTLTVQSSFIMALGAPFHLMSLPLLVGTLVLHRGSLYYGVAWFLLTAMLQWIFGFSVFAFWIYPLLAIAGVFLVTKLFTNNSSYAFLGLHASLITTAFIFTWLSEWSMQFNNLIVALAFMVPISYIALILARNSERIFSQFFFERS